MGVSRLENMYILADFSLFFLNTHEEFGAQKPFQNRKLKNILFGKYLSSFMITKTDD